DRYLKGGQRSMSRREIPISDQLAAALRDHQESWGGHTRVFTHENGGQLNSDQLGGASRSSSVTPGSASSTSTACGTRSRRSWTTGGYPTRRSRT
ncbi:MAG: hypothetical protein WAK58_21650, partial [Trebonia sp.]